MRRGTCFNSNLDTRSCPSSKRVPLLGKDIHHMCDDCKLLRTQLASIANMRICDRQRRMHSLGNGGACGMHSMLRLQVDVLARLGAGSDSAAERKPGPRTTTLHFHSAGAQSFTFTPQVLRVCMHSKSDPLRVCLQVSMHAQKAARDVACESETAFD
jgi:hypothetical protein